MKKLILIQNDFAGTGKTTLARAIARYLTQNGVGHQSLVLSEDEAAAHRAQRWVDPSNLNAHLFGLGDAAFGITILEAGNGYGKQFAEHYARNEIADVLHEFGVELTVVIAINEDEDSREGVVDAAETYSDGARYVIARVHPDGDDSDEAVAAWKRSYAARVMDMFEAAELEIPAAGAQIDSLLRARGTDLADSLLEDDPCAAYGPDYRAWLERVVRSIDGAREDLFGDGAPDFSPPKKGASRVPVE